MTQPVSAEIQQAAQIIGERLGGVAVLFYGSVLRTNDLTGLLDFYVLTEGVQHGGLRGTVSQHLWPDISFEETRVGDTLLRAKVATMPLDRFAAAASGDLLDTTIWTRFVQPSALVWSASDMVTQRVTDAVAAASRTAARFAAVLGPQRGSASDYWTALFRQTYATELRVERPGRESQILAYNPERYETLLRLAWQADALEFDDNQGVLEPEISATLARRVAKIWRTRRRMGKVLNTARLVKAAFMLDGAARYGLWKIKRHTGIDIALTPWKERHPVLAAPGVMWKVWRQSGKQK
nr:hypothetical protein [Altericroceibacterium endophyticum]